MLAALPVRTLNPIRALKGIPPDSVIPGTALILRKTMGRRQREPNQFGVSDRRWRAFNSPPDSDTVPSLGDTASADHIGVAKTRVV
jgi:hypothetical protein